MSEPANIQLPPWSKPLFKNGDEYKYFAIHGGRGSGKSRSLATILLVKAAQAKHRVLCCREVQKSIKDSVKKLLDDEIDRLGWRSGFKSTETSIRCQNGSEFIFMGLAHNPDSVKSTEGITLCWVEEAQTLSQGSISTLIPTIRQPGAQIFFTWNPKSIKDPVDAMFRGDETPPRSFVRQVNYTDNPWFPDVLREEMEYDKKRDRGKYLHVWEGQYLERSNANVFQDWRVEPFETPEDAFLRYGCDWGFSVDPTVLIRCFTIGRKLYFDYEAYKVGCDIDDTPALFAEVPDSDKWPIIADSASPERISYMRKHGYPKMMKAKKGQKSVEEGIEFMRSHEIIVHPRCKHMAEELALYKYKIDPVTEEVTNVLEDKNNHLCIAEGTPIITDQGLVNIEDIRVGDYVLTRGGYDLVTNTWDRGERDVLTICTDRGSIVCTPDHEVLTNRGWLQADAVRYNDDLLYIEEHLCEQKSESSTESCTNDIPTPLGETTGSIFHTLSQVPLVYFTEIFGLITTGLYLLGTISTTLTLILLTMTLAIWNALVCLSTSRNTGLKNVMRSNSFTWTIFDTLLRRGTGLKRVWSGIVSMVIRLGQKGGLLTRPVTIAESRLPTSLSNNRSFVQTSANQHGEELQDWMMLTAHASTAKTPLKSINIANRKLVPARVQTVSCGRKERVYDLSVKTFHEFFASGHLVANCDAARYALEAVRRTVKNARKSPKITPIPSLNYWGKR